MEFYASWSPGDFWFPDYDPNSHVLISASSVPRLWNINHYRIMPVSLIIDSGGFRYAKYPNERLIPKDLLKKQLSMIKGQDLEVFLCTLDYPIFNSKMSTNEKDRCITQTIAYAYEMKAQFDKIDLPPNIRPMAIVQGYSVDSLRYCAHELKLIGFSNFGLGSLQVLYQNVPELIERVKSVINQVGYNIHIFGVSNVSIIRKLRHLGIASFDSARPAKSAMYNEIYFYINHQLHKFETNVGRNTQIIIPAKLQDYPCPCPVCIGHLNPMITIIGKRINIKLRAIHNYWHLKLALLE